MEWVKTDHNIHAYIHNEYSTFTTDLTSQTVPDNISYLPDTDDISLCVI